MFLLFQAILCKTLHENPSRSVVSEIFRPAHLVWPIWSINRPLLKVASVTFLLCCSVNKFSRLSIWLIGYNKLTYFQLLLTSAVVSGICLCFCFFGKQIKHIVFLFCYDPFVDKCCPEIWQCVGFLETYFVIYANSLFKEKNKIRLSCHDSSCTTEIWQSSSNSCWNWSVCSVVFCLLTENRTDGYMSFFYRENIILQEQNTTHKNEKWLSCWWCLKRTQRSSDIQNKILALSGEVEALAWLVQTVKWFFYRLSVTLGNQATRCQKEQQRWLWVERRWNLSSTAASFPGGRRGGDVTADFSRRHEISHLVTDICRACNWVFSFFLQAQ